jgi:alpha-D-ribose 1-methylphosphonate 5-triphosphate synthase subunit PhnG
MYSSDLTTAVIGMDAAEVDDLIGLFADQEVTITRPPRSGLIMLTATDSFCTDFHLGEVLVTEAAASVEGCEGFGMVAGEEPRKALARAVADALLRAGRPESLCRAVRERLTGALSRQAAARADEAALTAATKVSFDLMPGA